MILVTSVALSVLETLAVGLVGSVSIFVMSCSRQTFLRARSDLRFHASTSERSLTEIETEALKTKGDRVAILEVNGCSYFGKPTRLNIQIGFVVSSPRFAASYMARRLKRSNRHFSALLDALT